MELIGVSEGVLKYLRVHITTGFFPPGKKLNEVELSSTLKISRGPLREAFRVLENEYLIKSVPRKGSFVTDLTMDDCHNIFNVRKMMECFAIDALQIGAIRDLPGVIKALQETVQLEEPDDNDSYAKFDYLKTIANFHVELVKAAGNERLLSMYNQICPTLARYQSFYTYIPKLMDASYKEHERLLRLISSGRYEDAKTLLCSHIDKFVGLLEKTLNNQARAAM